VDTYSRRPQVKRGPLGGCTDHLHGSLELSMPVPKHLGKLLLGTWLVLTGLIRLVDFSFRGLGTVMALLAIVAGVLIILDRQ
jgi:hypothetical protein